MNGEKQKSVHIVGIGGKLMAGIAQLAVDAGYTVTGVDKPLYPPMSQVLEALAIEPGDESVLSWPKEAELVIGNSYSRGHPLIEAMLDQGALYTSGAEWLATHLLRQRSVWAVAGTHGKTTTTSLLTWIAHCAQLAPGYLIGGIARNLNAAAALGGAGPFIIEADEYDTAFFDKQPKFMHYRPDHLILNTVEFDHADIYPNLSAILQQFHYLVRLIPPKGRLLYRADDGNAEQVFKKGAWCQRVSVGLEEGDYQARKCASTGQSWEWWYRDKPLATIETTLYGEHNVLNALLAMGLAHQSGISVESIVESLRTFLPPARRAECLMESDHCVVIDDFAHHPTAIAATIQALQVAYPHLRPTPVIELGTRTLQQTLDIRAWQKALQSVPQVLFYHDEPLSWTTEQLSGNVSSQCEWFTDPDSLQCRVKHLLSDTPRLWLLMSNKKLANLRSFFENYAAKNQLITE